MFAARVVGRSYIRAAVSGEDHHWLKMELLGSLKMLLSLLLATTVVAAPASSATGVYKLCVPESYLESCHTMVAAVNNNDVHISCVEARDRLECLEKIQSHKADFAPVDPEDLYLASRIPNQDFNMFKEIRTKEEPAEEFRYEAVAVIRKDLQISDIQGLKGLKSCHTGIGRNVGYKIPLTKLTKMGLLTIARDPNLTSRESELKALSQFFSQACLVGKWSPDAELNSRLKASYPNLCELCEHPAQCDYPDKYSGYDGALRCLSENGGDVAWTKVYYVKKHFGIGGREATAVNPDDYAYLCPDGTKAPMSAKPTCTWAKRPWQGYLTSGQDNVAALRNAIAQANTVGESTHADWLKVLMLDNKTVAVDNKQPQTPQGYLDKAQYTDVIERTWGSPNPVRMCTTSDEELAKCRDLSRSAWSRDVRPAFDCIQHATVHDCLKAIKENNADIISVDAEDVVTAQSEYSLKPIMKENHSSSSKVHVVAVVKKDSTYQSLADLQGARSCRSSGSSTGKCACSDLASYYGDSGVFRCLASGEGDVAFTLHDIVQSHTDGKSGESWASGLKSSDYELLCPDGGRASLDQHERCNMMDLLFRMVVTRSSSTDNDVYAIRHALSTAADLYAKRPQLFKLFGKYHEKSNLLFRDSTIGLVPVQDNDSVIGKYSGVRQAINTCAVATA